jgi:HK97 family phage portal protein
MKLIPDFVTNLFQRKASNSLELFREIYGGSSASSGVVVNSSTALETSVVHAACRLIGNDIAQSPLKLMQQTGDTKRVAREHPLYKLMAKKPNRWQTSFQWRQMVSWHVELCGNHFSYISRLGNTVVELFPFLPQMVNVVDKGRGVLEYEVTFPGGGKETYPASAILHIRGPSWDGVKGIETFRFAREAIGLALATESSAATLHKNGVKASGTYSVEGTLTDAQHKLLTKWIEEYHSGSQNAGKPFVLDRKANWLPHQMTGIDAQALETRNHQIEEVCRFFGVLPLMIGYSGDKASTYASAEQMFLAHERNCLSPRWTDYEMIFDTMLLTEKEQDQGYYFKFTEGGRLRGSIRDKKDVIIGYVNGGILTPNEGRELLDMNPMSDEASNQLRVPQNITGANDTAPTPPQG